MKVTVCQLQNQPEALAKDWQRLVAHVQQEQSDLVLFPEMPFHGWLAETQDADPVLWQTAVNSHDEWLLRLPELAPATVLGSRPIIENGRHHNRTFIWEPASGHRLAHTKYYVPQEEHFWEESWYERGDGSFTAVSTANAKIGFMLCTDLWFMQHARAYGQAGVQIIANPRATAQFSRGKWLVGGQAAAIISGAYCLSSNHVGPKRKSGLQLGGMGWVIDPDGKVLGKTSAKHPFITVEIDLNLADEAKQTYPRYVKE
ncbi:MAG: carbon-nitrogen hydrolase family protein [Chloroflexi bacterium]|nr:carbon-nitrogen hydrolase family protein [Chloroflexota bacterium]